MELNQNEDEFRKIAIREAAHDRRLRGSLEWLILGDTFEVSPGFLEVIDRQDILDDIAVRYQIGENGALMAEELCEQQIEEAIKNGEY
jgi:hypothetical protein